MAAIVFSTIDKLPDNILLDILSYLPVKERCIAGSVCKRWRRIANDNSLWRHVDLLPYRLDLQKMWKVIRAHFSDVLLTILLRGFWNRELGLSRRRKQSLSDAMLNDLRERCPNIRELGMNHCYIDNLDAAKLPQTLHTLTLNHCSWKPKWLQNMSERKILPNIKHLDLSYCVKINHFDIVHLCERTDLEVLKLNGCYRIGENGFMTLATTLSHLHTLEISDVSLTDMACHHIGRHMKSLKTLKVAKCHDLTNSRLAAIISGLSILETLDISHCDKLTDKGLSSLRDAESLKTLIVCGGLFASESTKDLQTHLPSLNVICVEEPNECDHVEHQVGPVHQANHE